MIVLEHVAPEDWAAVGRNSDALMRLVVDTGGQSLGVRAGSSSVTFTASAHSANKTITHGLGRAPRSVTFGTYNEIIILIVSKSAADFVVQGWAPGGVVTATLSFDWQAIG